MSIIEKLLPFIEAQNLTFDEFSFLFGISSDKLLKKIERGRLGAKDAFTICEILKLETPSDIFFYY